MVNMPAVNQMDDHDILIELRTNFNAFSTQYKIDMQELKTGTAQKLADHEIRLDALEKVSNQVQPVKVVKEFRELQRQVRDYVVGAKTAQWMIGGITALLGSILTTFLISLLKDLGIIY